MGDPVQPTKLISIKYQYIILVELCHMPAVLLSYLRLITICPIWAIISLLCQFFKVARL